MSNQLDRIEEMLVKINSRMESHENLTVQLMTMLSSLKGDNESIKEDVKAIREHQIEQDKVVDILSARTTRLQAKIDN